MNFSRLAASARRRSAGLPRGDIFNEFFSGGGYENTWTEYNATLNPDATPPGSPPAGVGNHCLDVNYAGGANAPFALHDLGANVAAVRYCRFFFYLDSSAIGNTDQSELFTVSEGEDNSSSGRCVALHLKNNGGTLEVRGVGSGAQSPLVSAIALGTWYQVKLKYTPGGAAGCEVALYDAAGTQLGAAQVASTNNNFYRYIRAGIGASDNTAAVRYRIAALSISTTDNL